MIRDFMSYLIKLIYFFPIYSKNYDYNNLSFHKYMIVIVRASQIVECVKKVSYRSNCTFECQRLMNNKNENFNTLTSKESKGKTKKVKKYIMYVENPQKGVKNHGK